MLVRAGLVGPQGDGAGHMLGDELVGGGLGSEGGFDQARALLAGAFFFEEDLDAAVGEADFDPEGVAVVAHAGGFDGDNLAAFGEDWDQGQWNDPGGRH